MVCEANTHLKWAICITICVFIITAGAVRGCAICYPDGAPECCCEK